MRRRRGERPAEPPAARAPVEATATFRSTAPHHGLAAFVLARIVRTDGSFILARGATVPDALRRAACAVENEQAVGPIADARRRAFGALQKAIDIMWNGEQSEFDLLPTLDECKAALRALNEDLRFDAEHDLDQVRFVKEVPRG